MISRAFIRLLPFLCLLVASSAKHNDTPSRRLSSPRRLKGMHNINIIESASPPIIENDWHDPAKTKTDNRHELRFLEKKSGSATKSKTDKESTTDKKGKKTKTSPSSIEPVSPTQPSATEDEVPVHTSIVSGTDDDGLLS
mmetsp:Transcript_16160/g.20644  ORF Transcript_16160/g.20644 Transcript_16160/m.20644 type:complete len:140 (+) Transcript_16160:61-480(+)